MVDETKPVEVAQVSAKPKKKKATTKVEEQPVEPICKECEIDKSKIDQLEELIGEKEAELRDLEKQIHAQNKVIASFTAEREKLQEKAQNNGIESKKINDELLEKIEQLKTVQEVLKSEKALVKDLEAKIVQLEKELKAARKENGNGKPVTVNVLKGKDAQAFIDKLDKTARR